MQITMKLDDRQLQTVLKKGGEQLRTDLKKVIRDHATAVARDARAAAPVFTGTLRDRIRARVSPSGLIGTVKSSAPHSWLVAHGRRAGKMPSAKQIADAIAPWAEGRGIDRRAAFVIARAIAAKGTKANRFFEETGVRHREPFLSSIRGVVERFTETMRKG